MTTAPSSQASSAAANATTNAVGGDNVPETGSGASVASQGSTRAP